MSKKVYTNSALNLQLKITAEINELLKERGINVSELKVDLRTTKKKSKKILSNNNDLIFLDGDIHIKINSKLNPKNNQYQTSEDIEGDEILDEDYDLTS